VSQLLILALLLIIWHILIVYVLFPLFRITFHYIKEFSHCLKKVWEIIVTKLVELWQFLKGRVIRFYQQSKLSSIDKEPWQCLKKFMVEVLNGLKTGLIRFCHFLQQGITRLWKQLVNIHISFPKVFENLGVGMIFAVSMLALHNYPVLMNIEDAGLDWVMKLRQNVIPPRHERGIPPFVFMDIDDKTYESWQEPLFTPRDRLQQLLKIAVEAKPRLIIVDVDLSREAPVEGIKSSDTSHPDQQLRKFMRSYAEVYCKEENKLGCPTILLARAFPSVQPDQFLPQGLLPLRPSFLDIEVAQSAPHVQWASVFFGKSEYDSVVRRWSLWQTFCDKEENPGVLPSIQLLAAALIRNGPPQRTFDLINMAFFPFQPKNCTKKYLEEYVPPKIPKTIAIGELFINTDMGGINQRIVYSMSWPIADNRLCDQEEEGCNSNDRPFILRVIPAERFADSQPMDIYKGSIVIIGGSHSGSSGNDIHQTPLDKMPGALIIINAIYSLLQYPTLDPLSLPLKLLIEAGLIILMSFFFDYFSSFLGMVLFGIVAIFLLLPTSIFLFKYGIWLDYALPLLAVQFHHIAVAFEELYEYKYGKHLDTPGQPG